MVCSHDRIIFTKNLRAMSGIADGGLSCRVGSAQGNEALPSAGSRCIRQQHLFPTEKPATERATLVTMIALLP
jgi:hypothetical protein